MSGALHSSEVVVRGVRSPVLHAGRPDAGEAVVFVHGNPGPAEDWADLLARVGGFAPAFAPDMPGFGNADAPSSFDYTIGGYARHLGGVLDELGVRRAHLVVHDFGGAWALAWAASNPDAFASATLINGGSLIDYKWHRYARIWRTPVVGELFMAGTTRAAFRVLLRRENPRLPAEAIDRVYEHSRRSATRRAVLKLYRATPASMTAGPVDELRALDRPALVLWGTYDPYIPWQQAERQRKAFPSARVELLEGLAHWPFLEDPGWVASLVLPFLREQLAVGDSAAAIGGSR
jgi:pimeloyl-ACP methyl ester carboxylesterase